MAEIPVQPKRGIRPWVWIVALIVIAAILWLVFGRPDTMPATTGSAVPTHVTPEPATNIIAPAFAVV